MKNFTESIQYLISLVTEDPHLESAWLSTLAHMEHLASQQVLGNISASTPLHFVNEIQEHAADEARHRDIILSLRPYPLAKDGRYEDLRHRLRAVAESFVLGFFANPVLLQAQSRFAAYVHGAITIEQFPFQIYSAYIDGTGSPRIREGMQEVLADEVGHIQLGKKFLATLPEAERLSLQELQIIEKEMCLLMVQRMTVLVQEFQNHEMPTEPAVRASQKLVRVLADRPYAQVAWVHALGHSELMASLHMQKIFISRNLPMPDLMPEHVSDELRHARLLQRSVVMERRKWLSVPGYRQLERRLCHELERYLTRYFSLMMREIPEPEQLYLYGAWGLEMRVFRHYTDIMRGTDHVGVAQTISVILQDEAEHTRMVHEEIGDRDFMNVQLLKWVRQTEDVVFEHTASRVLSLIEVQDQMSEFAPLYQRAFPVRNLVRHPETEMELR
ncbi:ferritin-like domain-containing protein [Bdellovibrio bacteriovorus]|uniref:ferritin-like domain-containing protein n=1 Tax=Bdellovibrio bacteriovorus TaxID=959 RepID=UPI003AA80AAF